MNEHLHAFMTKRLQVHFVASTLRVIDCERGLLHSGSLDHVFESFEFSCMYWAWIFYTSLFLIRHFVWYRHGQQTRIRASKNVFSQSAANAAHSSRLSDWSEYVYTAQSGCGFVFMSRADTAAAPLLHLYHLCRLSLALSVRSQHASMLPWHHSNAKRDQASPSLHPGRRTLSTSRLVSYSLRSFPIL